MCKKYTGRTMFCQCILIVCVLQIVRYYTYVTLMFSACLKNILRVDTAKSGFTLIEVLVAISVMATMGFIPISIVTQHLIQNALTQNRVGADLLAQEIIEYVRYTRDSEVLDSSGGDWFDMLYSLDDSNEYRECVVFADDWIEGIGNNRYCRVKCLAEDDKTKEPEECGTKKAGVVYNGFVVGTAVGGQFGTNEKTCDGGKAKEDNQFTTTLRIVIPREGSRTRYATIAPCISWSDKSGAVKKVTLKETVFEWIKKK